VPHPVLHRSHFYWGRHAVEDGGALVDHVIPHVPVRQWVLSLPIPLRVLLAAQPELVTPVLQVLQRVVERRLLDHDGVPGRCPADECRAVKAGALRSHK